jgi:hypothetical protein
MIGEVDLRGPDLSMSGCELSDCTLRAGQPLLARIRPATIHPHRSFRDPSIDRGYCLFRSPHARACPVLYTAGAGEAHIRW